MEYVLLGALVLLVLIAAAFTAISNKRKSDQGKKSVEAVARDTINESKAA